MSNIDLDQLTPTQSHAYMHLIGRALAKSRSTVLEPGDVEITHEMLAHLTKRTPAQAKQTFNQILKKGYFDEDGVFNQELIPKELLQAQGKSVPNGAVSIKDLEEVAAEEDTVQNQTSRRNGSARSAAAARSQSNGKPKHSFEDEPYERVRVTDSMGHDKVIKVFEENITRTLEAVIDKDVELALTSLADSLEALGHKSMYRHPLATFFNERFRSGCTLVSCLK